MAWFPCQLDSAWVWLMESSRRRPRKDGEFEVLSVPSFPIMGVPMAGWVLPPRKGQKLASSIQPFISGPSPVPSGSGLVTMFWLLPRYTALSLYPTLLCCVDKLFNTHFSLNYTVGEYSVSRRTKKIPLIQHPSFPQNLAIYIIHNYINGYLHGTQKWRNTSDFDNLNLPSLLLGGGVSLTKSLLFF